MSIVDLFYKRAIDFKRREQDVGMSTYQNLADNNPSIDDIADSKAKEDAYNFANTHVTNHKLTGDLADTVGGALEKFKYNDSMQQEQDKFNKRELN